VREIGVEVCVDLVESALTAEAAGAARIELCGDLTQGGRTPSAGTIGLCCERLGIPVFVMIRPRGGDFRYAALEFEVMLRDIAQAKRLGAAGVVFGLLQRDARVDMERTRILVEEARPPAVTFQRAFDVCRDPLEALETLIAVGADRILTSGQRATAEAGLPLIQRLVRQAAGRIGIVAGGGIRPENVERVLEQSAVREIHLRGARLERSPMEYRNPEVDFGAARYRPMTSRWSPTRR
jgi:copper homeostasis protein